VQSLRREARLQSLQSKKSKRWLQSLQSEKSMRWLQSLQSQKEIVVVFPPATAGDKHDFKHRGFF